MKNWQVLLALAALMMVGCQSESEPTKKPSSEVTPNESISDQIGRQLDRAKTVLDLAPSRSEVEKISAEEAVKLQALEYHVAEYSADTPVDELQSALNTLGKDRWDCSDPVLITGERLRFVCKRRPKSYLNLLPQALGLTFSELALGNKNRE